MTTPILYECTKCHDKKYDDEMGINPKTNSVCKNCIKCREKQRQYNQLYREQTKIVGKELKQWEEYRNKQK